MALRAKFVVPVLVAVVFVAAVGVLLANRGDEPASPAAATVTPAQETPTTATPTVSTAVTTITRLSIPAGGVVPDGWGLIIGNHLTGGAEVWLMPRDTDASGISPSGRYFVWENELFDGWTGTRTLVNSGSDAVVVASFSLDDRFVYIEDAAFHGRVLTIDGSEVARLPDTGYMGRFAASQRDVVWTTDGHAVAVTRPTATGVRTDAVVNGVVQPPIDGGPASWSNSGFRLLVSGIKPAIVDYASGEEVRLSREGDLPAWSDTDLYVAMAISEGQIPGMTVLDPVTGLELLRVYNPIACFDIYWTGDTLWLGQSEKSLRMPEGILIPATGSQWNPRYPRLGASGGFQTWSNETGVYATVQVTSNAAASFSWIRRDVDGFPPVLFLGRGGKDICSGTGAEPVVVRPPFSAGQVPAATPTPNK